MSQFGADRWVLTNNKDPGFYLDVGCHDGVEISNTYLLDKAGWKGLCIDPFPRNFEHRTATVVKAVVYSSNDNEVEFDYSVEDPGCSGIDAELGMHRERLFTTTTIQKHKFTTRTLESILTECDAPRKIEYMNMDIEGAEYEALRVFPFDKWSFKMMSIEHNFEEPKRTQIRQLLESKGYRLEHSVYVDDWYVNTNWIKPKVIVSLTSVPSRFEKLPTIVEALTQQMCHEIWINIPKKYTRFPDWDGQVPDLGSNSKVKLNRPDEDWGPGTKFIAPALASDADLIIYVDDDTVYDQRLVMNLLKWHRTDPESVWGMSGFNFKDYFKGQFPRIHGEPYDVIEGYGGVIVKAEWIRNLVPEFKELLEATPMDDIIVSNLFAKAGLKCKTISTADFNLGMALQQLPYGFGPDALHSVEGGHLKNNAKILESFTALGKNYFKASTV